MDTKLLILEACVGVCSLVGIYIALVLSWFQCKKRKPPTPLEVPNILTPETSFHSEKKERHGENGNGTNGRNTVQNGSNGRRRLPTGQQDLQTLRHGRTVQNGSNGRRTHANGQRDLQSLQNRSNSLRNSSNGRGTLPNGQHDLQTLQNGSNSLRNGTNGQQTVQYGSNGRRSLPNGHRGQPPQQGDYTRGPHPSEHRQDHVLRRPTTRQAIPVTTNHVVALQRLCLCASWLVLVRYGMEHAVLILATTESFSSISCEIILRVHIVFYVVPLTLQYIFLWMKQRVLYLNPVLRHNSWGCTSCVSWLVIIIFIVSEAGSVAMFMISEKYERNLTANATANFTWAPCVPMQTGVLQDFAPWLVLGLLALFFQALFFALFIQPLVCKARAINVVEMAIRRHQTKSVFPRIKRVFLVSSTSAITDLIAIVGSMAAGDLYISLVILDFNLLINQICLVLSYQSWKIRFFPMCCEEPPEESLFSMGFHKDSSTSNGAGSSRSPTSSTSTGVEEVFG